MTDMVFIFMYLSPYFQVLQTQDQSLSLPYKTEPPLPQS
jgi:hypothetical protein